MNDKIETLQVAARLLEEEWEKAKSKKVDAENRLHELTSKLVATREEIQQLEHMTELTNVKPTQESVRELLSNLTDEDWCENHGFDFDFNDFMYDEDEEIRLSDNLVIKNEERYGGDEGDGEEHWVVLSLYINGEKTYWQIPGWYQSYEGGELEYGNTFQVKPQEKTITVWVKA